MNCVPAKRTFDQIINDTLDKVITSDIIDLTQDDSPPPYTETAKAKRMKWADKRTELRAKTVVVDQDEEDAAKEEKEETETFCTPDEISGEISDEEEDDDDAEEYLALTFEDKRDLKMEVNYLKITRASRQIHVNADIELMTAKAELESRATDKAYQHERDMAMIALIGQAYAANPSDPDLHQKIISFLPK